MSSFSITIQIPKTFEEKSVRFPIYFKEDFSYYRICTSESYIEVNLYDGVTSIEYHDENSKKVLSLVNGFLTEESSVLISKEDFYEKMAQAEKRIHKFRDENYWENNPLK